VRSGAGPSHLPPLPATALDLAQFEGWLGALQRHGIRIDTSKLPPAVRQRAEAGR
jgi:hypothetical protein